MSDHRAHPSPSPPAIVLHGRRLRLSETQARLLAVLFAHQGGVVADRDLPARGRALRLRMTRLRAALAPHGLVISRVQGAGYRLVREEERP
jgi:DNA-binding response OmpR family regulator